MAVLVPVEEDQSSGEPDLSSSTGESGAFLL